MAEFAKFLISAGITSKRFSAITRVAYFLAASDQARFANDRLNQSTVAAMTGLTRAQVRGFAKQPRPVANPPRDRIDVVIEAWTTDPTFTDAGLAPIPLRLTGGGKNFGMLARRYGGDLPPRALLRELQRHGLVSVQGGVVSLKQAVAQKGAEYRLRGLARAMAELIRNGADGSGSRLRTVHQEVTYPASDEKGQLLMQKRASEGLRTYLSGLQTAGTAVAAASPPPRKRKGKVSRARILLITEDLDN